MDEAWNRVTTSVWWSCGNPGIRIAVHNVKCQVFRLFVCLFHNPIFVSIVVPLELGLGIHNPRFLGSRLELGLGTRHARSIVINRSTVFGLYSFVSLCLPIKMQGVGLMDFPLGYSTIVYLTFLFTNLFYRVLTYRS